MSGRSDFYESDIEGMGVLGHGNKYRYSNCWRGRGQASSQVVLTLTWPAKKAPSNPPWPVSKRMRNDFSHVSLSRNRTLVLRTSCRALRSTIPYRVPLLLTDACTLR